MDPRVGRTPPRPVPTEEFVRSTPGHRQTFHISTGPATFSVCILLLRSANANAK